MKKKTSFLICMLAICMLFLGFYENTYAATKKSSIKLNKSKATIYTSGNKTVQLKATVKGASKKVTWESSNRKVATVNSKGKVTAHKAGSVKITAKANGETATCKITVKKSSIKLNKNKATIYTSGNRIVQLKATVKGSSKKVTWKSSNKKIATVNAQGKVTAKKKGTVIIIAKANGIKAECTITVKAKKRRNIPDLSKVLHKPVRNAITLLDYKHVTSKDEFFTSGEGKSGIMMYYTSTGTFSSKKTYIECASFDKNKASFWTAVIKDKTLAIYDVMLGMSAAKADTLLKNNGWKLSYDSYSSGRTDNIENRMYTPNKQFINQLAYINIDFKNKRIKKITYSFY